MKIKELVAKIKKVNTEAATQVEKIKSKTLRENEKFFKQGVKALFAAHPDLESFSWSQYTPGWNDGDECVFSAHFEHGLHLNGDDDSEEIYSVRENLQLLEDKNSETKIKKKIAQLSKKKENAWEVDHLKGKLSFLEGLKDKPEEIERIKKFSRMKSDIVSVLESIKDEYFQSMFGEGNVIVTKDEVSVEECEHD